MGFFFVYQLLCRKKDMVNVKNLLDKPLWQMTGSEYVALHAYACSTHTEGPEASQVTRVQGVQAVAEYCACSPSQIAKLLREGVLESAILSRIGKSIVFDGDKARSLANDYQMQQRTSRQNLKKNE